LPWWRSQIITAIRVSSSIVAGEPRARAASGAVAAEISAASED
jgi:hypothetical protein